MSWCIRDLLILSRNDASAALLLYDKGFYPHAFFYLYQSLEKLIKAFILIGEPDEVKRRVNERIVRYAKEGKSFNVDDILCSEVLKYSVGHGAAWKFISWMERQYSRASKMLQSVMRGDVQVEKSLFDKLTSILSGGLEDVKKTYDEIAENYRIMQKLVDKVYSEVISDGEITSLDKVFEGISVLSDFTIKTLNEIKEEYDKINNSKQVDLHIKNVDACKEIEKEPRGREYFELIRDLASRQGSNPEEAIHGICSVLPCFLELLTIITRKILDLSQIYALIPFAAFLDRINAHEFSRYPVSKYISPLDIKKEHLESIRFKEIISLVIDSVDKLEDYLSTIHNAPKKLSKCASSINGTSHLASPRA